MVDEVEEEDMAVDAVATSSAAFPSFSSASFFSHLSAAASSWEDLVVAIPATVGKEMATLLAAFTDECTCARMKPTDKVVPEEVPDAGPGEEEEEEEEEDGAENPSDPHGHHLPL